MTIHFKRQCEIEYRVNLLRCSVLALRKRIALDRQRQMREERNRQRSELQLKPI